MTTLLQPPETKPEMREDSAAGILLHNISWDTYESLLKDHEDVPSPHFTYDRGELLIMPLSPEHETFNRSIALLSEYTKFIIKKTATKSSLTTHLP